VVGDAEGHPWLIDPSAFGGHRELDLAMLRLFGGPSQVAFDAYQEAHRLAQGWRDRVELYQLSPLLVHALLFGGSYRQAAERVAFHYGGR
jgi:fructosamine-3-kinase